METKMEDREVRAHLGRHLRMIEHIASHTEAAIPTNLSVPESELALDDEALRPYQLSHYVANSITTAVDVMSTARLTSVPTRSPTRQMRMAAAL